MSEMHNGLPSEGNARIAAELRLFGALARLQVCPSGASIGAAVPTQRLGAVDAAKLASRLAAIRHMASMLSDVALSEEDEVHIRAAIAIAVKSVATLGAKVQTGESLATADPEGLASLREWLDVQVQTALGRASEG